MSKRRSIKFSIRLKMIFGFLIVGILSSVAASFFIYNVISSHEINKEKNKLLMIARACAETIDSDLHSQLKPGDEDTEAYNTLLSKLRGFKEISNLTYLYTFKKSEDGTVSFVLDTDESDEKALIGDVYEADSEILSAFGGKPAVTEEPYTDEWGTFFSGMAPIYSSDNKVVAVVGADLSIEDVRSMQQRILLIIGTGIAFSILLSLFAAFFLSNRIGRPLLHMVGLLDDVVKNSGDLTQSIVIRTSDETGILADKTNELLANIKNIVTIIRSTALNINSNTREISEAIEATSAASETVSNAIGQITAGMSGQASMIHESTANIDTLSKSIDTLSANSI